MPLNLSAEIKQPGATPGILYMVATPIGNLGDITLRALDTLKSVDLIAAEDTRHTRKLLTHFDIQARLIACHEHNEAEQAPAIIQRLKDGASVALVSNAGTPTMSDPGYRILQTAIAAGIRVVPIPGVSAAVTALSASGLPTDAFVFVGFLPPRSAKRTLRLQALADESATLIFYESPRRIMSVLKAMADILGDRPAVLAREMTKTFEEFIRGPISEIFDSLSERDTIKGEITLLVAGCPRKSVEAEPDDLAERVREAVLKSSESASALARKLSRETGMGKNRIYEMILQVKSDLTNT